MIGWLFGQRKTRSEIRGQRPEIRGQRSEARGQKSPTSDLRPLTPDVPAWQRVHELPGRVRIRHEALIGDTNAAMYVEQELKATFGVIDAKASAVSGSVLVHFDPDATRTDQLLRTAAGILREFHSPQAQGYRHPYASMALTNSSLALAATAVFVAPALLPASAGLLVLTNVKSFRGACRELSAARPGTSMLYTAIVAATLVSGGSSLFAAALMGWFMNFWDRQYHRRLSQVQWQLLADFRRQPASAWISRSGSEVEVPVEQLRRGQVVVLRAGDRIPVDGLVLEGAARVDERLLRGAEGLSPKAKGARVYAGSLVFDGSLKVEVTRTGQRTSVAAIGRMIEQASTPCAEPLKVRGDAYAGQTVVPTLATAAAGLAVGGVGTGLAILRADYATGSGMVAPLGTLQDLFAALQVGLVVRDPQVFKLIREVDVLILDLPPASLSPAHANGHAGRGQPSASPRHPAMEGVKIGLVSEQSERELAAIAPKLGADFWHGGLSADQRVEMLEQLKAQGKRVAYVGDCKALSHAARAAHVAISLGDIVNHEQDAGQAFVLQPDAQTIYRLWEIARGGEQRRLVQEGCTLVPNLTCVAGAFLFDFTGLHTVLISNAGVWTVYRQGTSWLRGKKRGPETRTLPRQDRPTLSDSQTAAHSNGNGHAGPSFHRGALGIVERFVSDMETRFKHNGAARPVDELHS